ncbi:S-layer homology domain-containing protein [Solibacillus daqui]|uniref:S-layer homology domain-containing protein n=1 Tax=Solibacillus daqui TaxID=2912187 RepID=UPI0023670AD6|nr:S-layer homology domain-containing protein [Solibacillus daqui]
MNKQFKFIFSAAFSCLLMLVLMVPQKSSAQSLDFTGGIKNEYDYEEYIFLTGKPIKFTGTNKDVSVTIKENKGKLTETYKLTLTGPNGEKLTRNYAYTYDVTNYDQIGQSTATGSVTKFTEKIVANNRTYTLADYQLSDSAVTDKRPASDYYAGNAIARKTYTSVGSGKKAQPEEITIHINSRDEGYENFWGSAETQITDYEIYFADGKIGTVKNKISTAKSRVLEYNESDASLSSFKGNYKTISSADTLSEYEYDLPDASGKVALEIEYMPKIEMLKIPKFRDLSSSWARESIEKLYSLGILDDQSNFYSPNTPEERYNFAIAIGKAIDIRVLEEKKTKTKTATTIFKDVKRSMKDYNYLEAAVKKGVIFGITPQTFEPDGYLTREQAATILVRALGLEGKAPDPNYATEYKDDYKISDYARDSIYVATEIGLLQGDDGYFYPKSTLTRAESAAIIERFLRYLETDLKENYRDNILFYN